MENRDIWRTAKLSIDQHGDDAVAHARDRAAALRANGLIWAMVRAAITVGGRRAAPVRGNLYRGVRRQRPFRTVEHRRIAEAMTAANKRYTMTVFPDVGHGFFREDRESYNAAATQAAWDATLAFFAENPGG
jgi:pimeloyl-ACP methyl ester carboxylesterase